MKKKINWLLILIILLGLIAISYVIKTFVGTFAETQNQYKQEERLR